MDGPRDVPTLLACLRDGDRAALDELCPQLLPLLRVVVRQNLHPRLRAEYDSLDFVQDVWLSFWDAFRNRGSDECPLSSAQELAGYLARIAHGKVVDVFRQRFRTRKYDITRECDLDIARVAPDGTPTPSAILVADEAWEQMLSRVPDGHRPILTMLRDGYTYGDVARITGVSTRTVARVVRRLKDVYLGPV